MTNRRSPLLCIAFILKVLFLKQQGKEIQSLGYFFNKTFPVIQKASLATSSVILKKARKVTFFDSEMNKKLRMKNNYSGSNS